MLLSLLVLLSGCKHHINLEVLQPADVTLPKHIDRIAVLDRSRPKNTGQGVMDTIEGIFTGEAPGADRQGARSAVFGVVDVLNESPRYTSVVPLVDRDRFPPDIFDKPLTRGQVKEICRQNGCDALVALDAFDSDSVVTFDTHVEKETDSNGRELTILMHDAVRDTNVVSSWRLYDARDGTVLDEMRDFRRGQSWSASARTQAAAAASLANIYETTQIVGATSGQVYGSRIAPLYIWVSRDYFGRGDFKEARRYVQVADWDGAEQRWNELAKSSDPKIKGRALFNLALRYEVAGQLNRARKTAREAAVLLGTRHSRRYIDTLDWRIRERQRLNRQMEREDPGPVHPRANDAEQPLAIPEGTPAPAPGSPGLQRPPKPGSQPRPQPQPQPAPSGGLTRPR
jgi:hypothetical protein